MIYGLYLPRSTARSWDIIPFDFLLAEPSARNSILVGGETEIRAFLDRVDAMVDSRPGEFVSEEEAIEARELLISEVGRFLEVSLSASDIDLDLGELPRRGLVDDARDFVASHIEEPLTAGKLAEELFVSRRVLELAFRDAFGMGPYHFILNQKLHAIRRALLRQEGTIREISDRFGFVNAGRLAGMYTRLFGELPSVTSRGS